MVNHQRWATVLVTLVMVAVSWSPFLMSDETRLNEENTITAQHTEEVVDNFATSNGFSHTNLTQSSSSQQCHLGESRLHTAAHLTTNIKINVLNLWYRQFASDKSQ